MEAWPAIGLRFAVYADLLTLFGVLAWPFHARAAASLAPRRTLVVGLSVTGLILSIAAFLQTAATMSGTPLTAIDRETLSFLLWETPLGMAFIVRTTLLAAIIALGWSNRAREALLMLSGVALGTLAWAGHAAASEGVSGLWHRIADVGHLLAAGVWLGALVILAACVFRPMRAPAERQLAVAALAGFSTTGSIVVAILLLTGIVNLLSIIGSQGVPNMPATTYGLLLLIKLALFSMMLGLAAINRWRLTPLLVADSDGAAASVQRHLRVSILLELSLALTVLALVAWLGTLDPQELL